MKLSPKFLQDTFVYDPELQSCLRWKFDNKPVLVTNPFIFLEGEKVAISYIVWSINNKVLHPSKALIPVDNCMMNFKIENLKEVVLYQNPL